MAKDIFHDAVREALTKEGWIITADPLRLEYDGEKFEPDLAAERLLIAEKGVEKIAVEIKIFVGQSFKHDFYEALGQFLNYDFILSKIEPDRALVLAVPLTVYNFYFHKTYVEELLTLHKIPLVVYNIQKKEVKKWIR